MTLNKTWRLCLSMWRWIAEQIRKYGYLSVSDLKKQWLREHGFKKDSIYNDCFFCEHGEGYSSICGLCPGRKVDPHFNCENFDYSYCYEPIAFYNKLRALNRKRLAKK